MPWGYYAQPAEISDRLQSPKSNIVSRISGVLQHSMSAILLTQDPVWSVIMQVLVLATNAMIPNSPAYAIAPSIDHSCLF